MDRLNLNALPDLPQRPLVEVFHDGQTLSTLGRSSETEAEFQDALQQMREEGARVGRMLAERLGFDYPTAAEEAATS